MINVLTRSSFISSKSNSVKFPSDLQITEVNLIDFVMYNAQESSRQSMLIHKCNKKCLMNNYESSVKRQYTLNNEIKVMKQKTWRYKQQHPCNQQTADCSTSVNDHFIYLDKKMERKLSELRVTKQMIYLLPLIIDGKKEKQELLSMALQ